jgi:hypothetical protein
MDLAKKRKAIEPVPEPPKPPPQWRIIAGNLASGAIAGCIVEAALYPLDTIKTRLQLMRSGGGLRALLRSGGGKALYAGIWYVLSDYMLVYGTCFVITVGFQKKGQMRFAEQVSTSFK